MLFNKGMRIILVFLLFCANAFSATKVGQFEISIKDSTRNRVIPTYVWYQTVEQEPEKALTRGPFIPVVGVKNGKILRRNEKYPVVLISHGSGGKADKLFWLTKELVEAGFVVIGVNHPGNTTGDNSALGMLKVWERSKDLLFALDEVIKQKKFKDTLEIKEFGVVGHSAGGTTALLLAGGKFSKGKFSSPIPQCEGTKDSYYAELCSQMEKIDFNLFSKKEVESDYSDKRVKVAVAYDPGFSKSFSPTTLKNLRTKTFVFIADKLESPQDEFHSKEFINLLPKKSSMIVPNSIHMSFLQPCKNGLPKGNAELDLLCAKNNEKIEIQKSVATKTIKILKSDLNIK